MQYIKRGIVIVNYHACYMAGETNVPHMKPQQQFFARTLHTRAMSYHCHVGPLHSNSQLLSPTV